MKVTGEKVVPKDYELKEYWTWKPAGEKPWIVRVFTKTRIWEERGALPKHDGFPPVDQNGDYDSSTHRASQGESPVEDKYPPPRLSSPLPFRAIH